MLSPLQDFRLVRRLALHIQACALSLLLTDAADAQRSTITISGDISDTTCEVNRGVRDLTVSLPTIGITALRAVGDVAGATLFQLELKNCPLPLEGMNVLASFTSTANIDTGTNNLRAYLVPASAGDPLVAHGTVQIELTDLNSNKILLGAAPGSQNVPTVTVSASHATLNFFARYIKTADAPTTAARLTTTVNFQISYN